ncbi:MAG: cation diffusion facilitator family transporter, partial [Cardiobacteriaceae bacterium]|nr:cation diffusion facilitator family transporter [Cardiobacteriaceae bacterium]
YAMVEADDNHHFGHGKAESLSALAQGMFIAGSSIFLIVSASGRLYRPVPLNNDAVGIVVMLVSLAATAALVVYQRHVLRQVDSPAVRADSLNYLNDLLTTAGVLAALVLSALGWYPADPLIAIGVGLYMLRGVWIILKEAVAALMDVALPAEEMARIEAAIASVPGSEGVHRLRARRNGKWRMVDMHLEFDDGVSLFEAHEINDCVEEAIAACFDGPVEIMIHMEPKSVAHDDRHKLG